MDRHFSFMCVNELQKLSSYALTFSVSEIKLYQIICLSFITYKHLGITHFSNQRTVIRLEYNLRFQIFTRSTTNTNERYIDIDPKTLCCVSGDLLPFIRLENSHQVGKRLIYIVMYYCSIIMVVHFVGIEKLKDSLQTCKIISLPKDML